VETHTPSSEGWPRKPTGGNVNTAPRHDPYAELHGPSKGVLYNLYSIHDIYSRKVVDWTIALRERALIAEDVIRDTSVREAIDHDQLTLHADRGDPMIASGVAELLTSLDFRKRHSRPRLSGGYPFAKLSFGALRFRPGFSGRFDSAHAAYEWCMTFFNSLNHVRHHSGMGSLRPPYVHANRHAVNLERRSTRASPRWGPRTLQAATRPLLDTATRPDWIANPEPTRHDQALLSHQRNRVLTRDTHVTTVARDHPIYIGSRGRFKTHGV
jgi:putative transposase